MIEFTGAYPLIHNKVTSPRFTTPTLRRPRLLDWLNENANARAVVLAADAGYGTTTLLWQWEREVEFPCYWYKLDQNDRDWSLHISYLIESIAQRHPGFGKRAHSMLMQLGGPGSSRPGVAAYLLSEIYERLTEPCTFIIDDWQYVNNVTEVRGLWNQILRDAPPTCRFVFASRSKPRLQFARFKTHGGYAQIGTDALRLTDVEIDSLFRDIYLDPLDPAELTELERRTEGWAASLQLVEVSLRERQTPEARREFIQSITATSDSDLFIFLAEEVLDKQTEQTRNFLLCTSILQQITPDLAERLAGVHDGTRELEELEKRGLFTFRLDDARYRYHNLFRDFLERKLTMERSETEVIGLHIHAASYFETTEQWPQAIHHYLRAGLQPQAARLIAKHGEDVVAEGRLGLVDEWLQQLPVKTITSNARLSLLQGEAYVMRGDWPAGLSALERARAFFHRKGDRRMEALALLKLSTSHTNQGDTRTSAEVAREGLSLAPEDALATRLRLRGNLAITATWLDESLTQAARECMRIAAESMTAGLDHLAAIAHHNLGVIQRHMGQLKESALNLERAATFWNGEANSPFGDNAEWVFSLLASGEVARAERAAEQGVLRTRPWPRPHAEARCGLAAVYIQQGRFETAIELLKEVMLAHSTLGGLRETALTLLIEAMFLSDAGHEDVLGALGELESRPTDARQEAMVSVARSLAGHALHDCNGRCQRAKETLDGWADQGAKHEAAVGRVKLALLEFDHRKTSRMRVAFDAIEAADTQGALPHLKLWLRRFSPYINRMSSVNGHVPALLRMLEADADHWRGPLTALLPSLETEDRANLLTAIMRHANRLTVGLLRGIDGADVLEARRRLIHRQASRLYVRSFGSFLVHRGSWGNRATSISRRRPRHLFGLLIAYVHASLTRDIALDILWPDAGASAAVNNLNQTVFQLRRELDPTYKEEESPHYILSALDSLQFDSELVRTDLEEFRQLAKRLRGSEPPALKLTAAEGMVDIVRGEFLTDVKYEPWVEKLQMAIHAEVRQALLPLAAGDALSGAPDLCLRAACALALLDQFDEEAHLAMAHQLAIAGRRPAARDVLVRFASRLHAELDELPSPTFVAAAVTFGVQAEFN